MVDEREWCCACEKMVRVDYHGVAFDDIPTCMECDSDELEPHPPEDDCDAAA